MLEVSSDGATVYPTIVYGDEHLVLIDTAYPNQIEELRKEIQNKGYQIEDLTEIIITHQDWDHIGCLHQLLKLAPKAKVLAYEEEIAYLDGRKIPHKLEAFLTREDSLTEDEKIRCENFKKVSATPIEVTQSLHDKEVLPFCGGIEIIHTPGHTIGHISLYLQESKTLICGDAANIQNGELIHLNPKFIYDTELAGKSLNKIKNYEVNTIIAHHSGIYKK